MTAFVGGREVAEEDKDTEGPAASCLRAYLADSEGCRWPAGECMHNRLLGDLEGARGVQLAEKPCEGPSAAGRFVKLVVSPCLAAGCELFGYPVLHAGRRQPHSVSAATRREYA